ncbi:cytochrome P450 [Aspergillus pseudoustus]|uniref:Cytochrome P450 n=1 Tax=Aspergillus pseudoustus TaxID=1810923 RepID=A0ABR4K6A2_9EURO
MYLLALIVVIITSVLFHTWRKLHEIPGPFWAKFTNLQRVYWVKTMRSHDIHQHLHAQYGDIVRMGPNMVSIADPAVIPTLYTPRAGFPKSKFYAAFIPYTKGGSLPAIFTTQDEDQHKQLKSPIAHIYSTSNVATLEPFVDAMLQLLTVELDKRFTGTNQVFDLGDWLQYFAFETMGTMTFSRQYGLLRTGSDANGMLQAIWEFMLRIAPMTQIPWFDRLWYKNSATATLFHRPAASPILKIVSEAISEREQKRQCKEPASNNDSNSTEGASHPDFLDQFLDLLDHNPSVQPWFTRAWTFSNVIAGSDSTASVMKAAMYYLLTNTDSLLRLREELLQTCITFKPSQARGMGEPPIFPAWQDIKDLPFLDACINEAARLHPPFCLPLERVVPPGGVTLAGRYFAEGTVVGMNPYVVNRHRGVFGEDADEWRPERWLVHAAEKRRMEGSVLTFGAGRRICMGKPVALLEIKKVVAALVVNYEITLRDPSSYVLENSYFFRQKGINVHIARLTDSV